VAREAGNLKTESCFGLAQQDFRISVFRATLKLETAFFVEKGIGTTMDEQEKCLNKLIDSFNKVSISSLGGGKVGLDFYRNKKNNVLIRIGCKNKETDYKYLKDHSVISKGELFVKLFTGCTGLSSIDQMLESFDELHGESGSSDLSAFVQSLKASKIIIFYTSIAGGSNAALVILYNICRKFNIDCLPIIIKPGLFCGPRIYKIDVKYFTGYFDAHNYHIYDQDCLKYRLVDIGDPHSSPWDEMNKRMEEELLTIANSIMRC